MKRILYALIILQFSIQLIQAKISVSSVLGNGMVLQRCSEVKLWGKADPRENLTIFTSWNGIKTKTVVNDKGEWLVKVKTIEAGGPYIIKISSKKEKMTIENVLLGDVWLCSGQSNMEEPIKGYPNQPVNGSGDFLMDADNDFIRLFKVQKSSAANPLDSCCGRWEVATAESVAEFSAVGYLFAKLLQQKLQIPVGVICSSWGGSSIEAWMNEESITEFPEAYKNSTFEGIKPHHRATYLYNGMIAPIVNYAIKGVLWYQGGANIDNYYEYPFLQAAMVESWRKIFDVGEFPFYYVQLAPESFGNSKAVYSALQRDAQYESLNLIPNAGIVSTIDIGEEFGAHPMEKLTISKRLVALALSETYGYRGIPYKSPTFKSMIVVDSLAIVSFNDAPMGLTSYNKRVDCFEIAGEDQIFHPATIKIISPDKGIQVWSSQVKKPVAVRYGYCNYPKTEGYLYNTAGLPVISFRTDNWEIKPAK